MGVRFSCDRTHKSHITPYHSQGDGLVERFNRSLLQLLQSYVELEADWEVGTFFTTYTFCVLNGNSPIR